MSERIESQIRTACEKEDLAALETLLGGLTPRQLIDSGLQQEVRRILWQIDQNWAVHLEWCAARSNCTSWGRRGAWDN